MMFPSGFLLEEKEHKSVIVFQHPLHFCRSLMLWET